MTFMSDTELPAKSREVNNTNDRIRRKRQVESSIVPTRKSAVENAATTTEAEDSTIC